MTFLFALPSVNARWLILKSNESLELWHNNIYLLNSPQGFY